MIYFCMSEGVRGSKVAGEGEEELGIGIRSGRGLARKERGQLAKQSSCLLQV